MAKCIALIFAGGVGRRMANGPGTIPKQFLPIYGKPILILTLEHFQAHGCIDAIYIVMLDKYIDDTRSLVERHGISKTARIVEGGKTAQESIYNGLMAINEDCDPDDIVLIHDGVRPILSRGVISKNIESVRRYGSAITAIACHETIIVSEDGVTPSGVPLRKTTYTAQAPQSFRLGDILRAHNRIRESNPDYENIVDSCTVFHQLGIPTHIVPGNLGNIKVTTPEDVYTLKAIMKYRFDVDAFGVSEALA